MAKIDWINRVAKWRTVFTGWQLGTRAKGDPEADAVRDHRELSILGRVQLSAMMAVLIKKGVCTEQELLEHMNAEAEYLCKAYERRFPGFKATDEGLTMDTAIAKDTMAGWRP
jgi:hypothetical protein